MEIKTVHCSCGRTHECPIKHVIIKKDAMLDLAGITENYRNILLVADENTYGAAGKQTEEGLKSKNVIRQIFPGEPLLIPDEKSITAVTEKLRGVDLIVGIGSGVIQDLCKYVSHRESIPYMIVASAPSMDGYASSGAAMILNGMKVTVPSGLPEAIIADPKVLAKAPWPMIRAGYGDIIGKYSCLNDWKLAHLIKGEYFCRYIYDATYEEVLKVRSLAKGLKERSIESLAALMEALVTVGVMMSYAGSSRPASGSEHHLSHFFEITGIERGLPYFPHGIDVGYSSVITEEIREEILSFDKAPEPLPAVKERWEAEIRRVYRSVADGIIGLQKNRDDSHIGTYAEKWEEVKVILREAPGSKELAGCLSEMDFDRNEFVKMYGEERIRDAVRYGRDLKDRYSVLWLYNELSFRLKKKKLFLLDMDGTIYLDGVLFDGTLDFLAHVKETGGRYIFLTNNSSKGTEAYIEKLGKIGIDAHPEDFVTSADATIRYLKKTYPEETVYYVCGTESLKSMLRKAGLRVEDEPLPETKVVLLGYDTELTYKKLTDCCRLLTDPEVDYVATHPDYVCPVSYGFAPDCGSVIDMLYTAVKRRPVVIGKPQPAMAELAMEITGFTPEETILLGDRVYTDIACGVNAGIDTAFMLSGEGVISDMEKYNVIPTVICGNIREFLGLIE